MTSIAVTISDTHLKHDSLWWCAYNLLLPYEIGSINFELNSLLFLVWKNYTTYKR
jgi:hypothetical protein